MADMAKSATCLPNYHTAELGASNHDTSPIPVLLYFGGHTISANHLPPPPQKKKKTGYLHRCAKVVVDL